MICGRESVWRAWGSGHSRQDGRSNGSGGDGPAYAIVTDPASAGTRRIRFYRVKSFLNVLAVAVGAILLAGCNGDGQAATLVATDTPTRSEEHTSELQSRRNLVCRPLL